MRPRDDVLASLRERIVNGVHFGALAAGDRLPSARRLAVELDTDPRVVAAAYAELVRDGMVVRRAGSRGYFTAVDRGATGALLPSTAWLLQTLAEGIARGIPAGRFIDHARRSLESTRVQAVCVESNDDHLGWLCGELGDDYGYHTRPIDAALLAGSAAERRVAERAFGEADLVVTTAAHASAVRRLTNRIAVPIVLVTLRADVMQSVARLLTLGPVYFLATDPRISARLRALYRGVPHADRIRPIVLGRQDPDEIPTGAPTWVMRTALERLGGVPPHVHALPTARIFSADSARELLSHLIRLNLSAAERVDATAS